MSPDRKNGVPLFIAIGIIFFLVIISAGFLLFRDSFVNSGDSLQKNLSSQEGTRPKVPSPGKNASQSEVNVLPQAQTTPVPAPSIVIDKEKILTDLNRAACTYDASSLPKIEPYLYSKDKDLREAALNNIVTLGDAAGAPILRKAAKQSEDPMETAELLSKANYLELPSGTLLKRK